MGKQDSPQHIVSALLTQYYVPHPLSSVNNRLCDVWTHNIFVCYPLLVVGVTTMCCTRHAAGLLIFRHAVVGYCIMQGEGRQQPGGMLLSNS